ncbi:glycosyltransferase [Aquimarina longa]|uniref:glycosyltransferase n=1 Tax=Aquimarina longa TaxID=1080221 RepID=UPI000786733F|nr:glycosyltransferase [Aquimarina longa]
MNILIVDRSGAIPVKKYGGTERVIWGLGKELSKLGHRVTYLVPEGSKCDFATVLTLDKSLSLDIQIPDYIDIIHLNYNPKIKLNKPYLITMHGNPPKGEEIDINTVFISKNQAKRYNSNLYIHNGLDWSEFSTIDLHSLRSHYHFLGKASWKVKNVFGAISIALKSKNTILILGGEKWTFWNLKRGLKYILNPKVIFKGMVDNTTKMDIMQKSKGLIFPVLWHEPFGLAIIESLYAGCAVFGTKNGSLEELITPEIGFTGNSSDEISNAIKEFNYNPKYCHEYALKHFNSKVMTEKYLELYKKVLNGAYLNADTPKYIEEYNKISKFI